MNFEVLVIDGYIDEPGCLGVPPYLAPLPRYIFGAISCAQSQWTITYRTIDQYRLGSPEHILNFSVFSLVIFISGVAVPGKYLGGTPISFSELKKISALCANSYKILCGPITAFGMGEQGGKTAIAIQNLEPYFDLIFYGDAEIALYKLCQDWETYIEHPDLIVQQNIARLTRTNMDEISLFANAGSKLVLQHPNFTRQPFGNLICEIETFRGCPRYISGGCRFCIEPKKGPPMHRSIDAIVHEVEILYKYGVRHFRLGAQTDFYAFQHLAYENPRYPKPNSEKIHQLLESIRKSCPNIQTLHIDNVNPLNFVLYPNESRQITQDIVKYCTAGNIAAFGVESVDPVVIQSNNLKVSAEEVMRGIEIINDYGKAIGSNGNPTFLPGLNFIMGLEGESAETLELNFTFLSKLLAKKLWIRRINLRKYLIPTHRNIKDKRQILQHMDKFASTYFHWKDRVRNEIDQKMLELIYPIGHTLTETYAELHEGNGTLLRQIGTYPITCFVPRQVPLNQFYSLRVVNHGFRSLDCLVDPVDFFHLSMKELSSIRGIGKKRAGQIIQIQPKTQEQWKRICPESWDSLIKLQPLLLELPHA